LGKKIIGVLLIAILTIVLTASLSYVFSQPNPTENTPSPTPTPTPTPPSTPIPIPTLTPTPTPTPSEEPTKEASILKPSVPEFAVKYVDYSYDVPPTYGIDQYTGEPVITKQGYHVTNRTVEFTIKNQLFTSYKDANGNDIGLYYNFRFKGYYGSEWSYYPFKPDGNSTISYGMLTGDLSPKLSPSNTNHTNISIDLGILLSISSGYTGSYTYPSGGQMEFQAQALVGHIDYEASGLIAGSYYIFIGETSDWSSTQTITLP
jgi:hypothetical protein